MIFLFILLQNKMMMLTTMITITKNTMLTPCSPHDQKVHTFQASLEAVLAQLCDAEFAQVHLLRDDRE